MAPPTKKRSNSFIENSDEEVGDKPSSKTVRKEHTAETEEGAKTDTPNTPKQTANGVEIDQNKEGDKFFEVGNKRSRRVTVSSFKNTPLIDIREFYTNKEGESAPGKKGVSLKPDELQLIVDNHASIQEMLDGLNIKRK
ncbi:hypothetical protein E3P81_01154 [Wallemia ichthyophaga]|nr:hypothetical protein E3P97_01155 [Wallemia ichthyophaga]TIB05654.1 hypothetical protein E3P96_01066 [Wallemia ichthyophaga]TIB34430.1 hypothetical protein E3P85_00904 [Wallemia ichthyophaga]TIB48763.1 hypothetical protein E3P82_01153 [Wallemia ichthyophaga]TIB52820.1 hypothetical protein E3P81_01154 [Wallemia ichthyophaga]